MAAAGVGSGVGFWAGGKLGAGALSDLSARNIGANLASSAAGGIANAAARSLVNGSDFGDNVLAALPDIIGSTIGNLVAQGMAGGRATPIMALAGRVPMGGPFQEEVPQGRMGETNADGDIVVTARSRSAEDKRGFLWKFFEDTGVHAGLRWLGGLFSGGSNNRSFDASEVARNARMTIGRAASMVGDGANYVVNVNAAYYGSLYNRVLGPNSLYGRNIGQPVARFVTPAFTAVANSPVGDPGMWASIEGAYPPAGALAPLGSVLTNSLKPFASIPRLASRTSQAIEGGVPIAEAAAAERSIAAQNVWEARSILREAGLNPAQRGEVIRSFDMQTLRVERTASESTAYRLFDDTGARLEGRYVSGDFLANQTDRIQRFALPGNSATRLGEVAIPQGSVIFTGLVAPQLRFSPGLTGGANQTFLTGPLSRYTFREVPMPR